MFCYTVALLKREHFSKALTWAVSSGGEHYLDTVGVTSSNLVSPTTRFRRPPEFSDGLFSFENMSTGQVTELLAEKAVFSISTTDVSFRNLRKERHHSLSAGISDKPDGISDAGMWGLGKLQGANAAMKNFIHS